MYRNFEFVLPDTCTFIEGKREKYRSDGKTRKKE
jgi:hypothetical protein